MASCELQGDAWASCEDLVVESCACKSGIVDVEPANQILTGNTIILTKESEGNVLWKGPKEKNTALVTFQNEQDNTT